VNAGVNVSTIQATVSKTVKLMITSNCSMQCQQACGLNSRKWSA